MSIDFERQTRRAFLKHSTSASVAPAFGWMSATLRGNRRPPNLILVLTDDQGYGDLGCHGNSMIRTPNLDCLHSESVRLTNFHVDPLCAPTRSALMTGCYAFRAGVTSAIGGHSLLRRGEVTMAELFADSGYQTGIFGKWHLGDNYPLRPQERGFGQTMVFGGATIGATPDFWGNSYFNDTYWCNGKPEKSHGYCTDVFFDAAMAFLEANRARPFFLYLPTNAPHGPYNVPESYSRPYLERGVPPAMAAFYGMITNIDENIGRLLHKLRTLGLEENTILIFMTDNGTAAGVSHGQGGWNGFNDGMRASKSSQYDGGHRVPCFIRWPGGSLSGGRDIGRLSAHIDVLPTLVRLCGLKVRKDVQFDGLDLVPLLTSQGKFPNDRIHFIQHQQIQVEGAYQMENPQPWRNSAVLTEQWRLVDGKELYDVKADPSQSQNIAGHHPDVVGRLRKAYDQWYPDVMARFHEGCEIVLGSDHENPARVNCFDWHGERIPWNQRMVRLAPEANGFWLVEVSRNGRYEFTLRQQPAEARFPLAASTARLRIAQVDVSKPVPAGATGVVFKLELKAGKTRMQTWLHDKSSISRGAFYVDVRRLS